MRESPCAHELPVVPLTTYEGGQHMNAKRPRRRPAVADERGDDADRLLAHLAELRTTDPTMYDKVRSVIYSLYSRLRPAARKSS